MKTKLILLLNVMVCLLLTSCLDDMKKSSVNTTPLTVVITQPENADAIAPLMESLSMVLNESATASKGATVLSLDLKILQSNGQTVSVPAPANGLQKSFFGNSPLAMMQRLKSQLIALETKLKAGATGPPMYLKTLQEAPKHLFRSNEFIVWAASGGANPWTAGDIHPAAFTEDRSAFEEQVLGKTTCRNFLVLTDAINQPLAKKENKIASENKIKAAQTKAAKPNTPPTPVLVTGTDPEVKESDIRNPSVPGVFINNTINGTQSNPNASANGTTGSPLRLTSLPPGAENLGAILFSTSSDKLDKKAWDMLNEMDREYKNAERSDTRLKIFLMSSADHRGGSKLNRELSENRARAVEGALLQRGIVVERSICVGDSLAPKDTPEDELNRYREVRVFMVREPVTINEPKVAQKEDRQ